MLGGITKRRALVLCTAELEKNKIKCPEPEVFNKESKCLEFLCKWYVLFVATVFQDFDFKSGCVRA